MNPIGKSVLITLSLAVSVIIGQINAQAAEVHLTKLKVKNPLKAGVPYRVTLPYTKTGKIKIIKGCFFWSGEGPYCFPVSTGSKTISVNLRTGNPNTYTLTGYVSYRSGGKIYKSNRVSHKINVKP